MNCQNTVDLVCPVQTKKAPVVRQRLHAWLAMLGRWRRNHRSRRELLSMNDAMLKDIGVSRADAFGESEKPFWRD